MALIFDQKFKNSGDKNSVGNSKLLNTGDEFSILEFCKAKVIAIAVGLKMNFHGISYCEIRDSFNL